MSEELKEILLMILNLMKVISMQYFKWFLFNVVQLGSLYGGLVMGIDGLANLFIAFIWVEIFISFMMYSKTMVDIILKAPIIKIPDWVSHIIDLTVICAMIWVSWWFTAIVFGLAWCVRSTVKGKIRKYRAQKISYAQLHSWE